MNDDENVINVENNRGCLFLEGAQSKTVWNHRVPSKDGHIKNNSYFMIHNSVHFMGNDIENATSTDTLKSFKISSINSEEEYFLRFIDFAHSSDYRLHTQHVWEEI